MAAAGFLFTSPERTANEKAKFEASQFNIDPVLESGMDMSDALDDMRLFASQHPHEYIGLRQNIKNEIVKSQVRKIHQEVWKLFTEGTYGGKKIEVKINDTKKDWNPSYPRAKVDAMAASIAMAYGNAWEGFLNEIMPVAFDQLTTQRIKEAAAVGRSGTIAREMGAAPAVV